MVVSTINCNFCDLRRLNILNKGICFSSFYLQPFLVKKSKAFETIIVLALVAIIGFLIYEQKWLLYLSLVLLLIPVISIKISIGIAKIWFIFSEYFGLLMNAIIMFICFYLFLVPLSFLQKMFGKNQLLKKEGGDSYFHKRNHLFTRDDIQKPW